jgi:hypothetical protein
MKPEYILCAAIWYLDYSLPTHSPVNIHQGVVLCGYRHCNIIGQVSALLNKRQSEMGHYEQGFLTSANRFVSRKEAYEIAFRENQIIGPNKGRPYNEIGLTSEDLY